MKTADYIFIFIFLFILALVSSLVYNAKEAAEKSLIEGLTKPGDAISPNTFNNLTSTAQKLFTEKGGIVKRMP